MGIIGHMNITSAQREHQPKIPPLMSRFPRGIVTWPERAQFGPMSDEGFAIFERLILLSA
jgi:hypothetical protein